MNKQAIAPQAAAKTAAQLPSRFDLRSTGLTDAQLKSIAGARPGGKSPAVTVVKVTVCCW